MITRFLCAAAVSVPTVLMPVRADAGPVHIVRVPDGGIEPAAKVEAGGRVHIIYFKGDPAHGDVYYAHSGDGAVFSAPLRVNSTPGSALVVGSVRGPRLALGKGGRVHVTWTGSDRAKSRGKEGAAPLLYARMNDARDAFEPERNIISRYEGLDGGGAVGADLDGNVYVAWHAPSAEKTEADRFVWIAHSQDEGKTFAPETAANVAPTGACACCGLEVFVGSDARVYVLYRSATRMVHRDVYLLVSSDHGASFESTKVGEWNAAACVMSTAAFAQAPTGVAAAWESEGRVRLTTVKEGKAPENTPAPAPGGETGRKHPALAADGKGRVLVAWTEGAGWEKGGGVGWVLLDADGKPVEGGTGKTAALPVWGTVAAYTRPDGSFVVMYGSLG